MANKGAIDLVVQQQALDQVAQLNKGLREAVFNLTEVSKLGAATKGTFQQVNSKGGAKSNLSQDERLTKSLADAKVKLADSEHKLGQEITRVNNARLKNNKATRDGDNKAGEYTKKIDRVTKATKTNTKATTQNTKAKHQNAKATKEGSNRLVQFFKTLVLFDLARRGVQLFWDSLKQGFENIKGLQSLSLQLKFLVKDTADVIKIQTFMKRISEDLGVELLKASQSFLLFRKSAELAGLSLEDTMDVFESTTKAASVLGKSDAEIRNVQVALEQMLSKGTVQAEELKKQLGNVLPGAFQIMAKAVFELNPEMEKTNKAFIKMLETGKIISADVLPEFARQLEKAYGIEAVERIETVAAAQNRVANAFTSMVDALESEEGRISNVWINILGGIEDVIEALEDAALGSFGVGKKFEGIGERQGGKNAQAFADRVRVNQPLDAVDDETVLAVATLELEERILEAQMNRRQFTAIADKQESDRINKRISLEIGGYRATLKALNELLGKKEEAGEDDIEIQDRNITFLQSLIAEEEKLMLLQTDTGAGVVIQTRIDKLKQEIALIKEGLRLAQQTISDVKTKGVSTVGGGTDDGNLQFIEKQIDLLEQKNFLTKDPSVNQALVTEIGLYGELANALETGDYSGFAEAGAAASSKFLNQLQRVNPELARQIGLLIETAEATGEFVEAQTGLTQGQQDMVDLMMLSAEAINSFADVGNSLVERRVVALEWEMEKVQEKYDLQKELIEAEIGDEESKAERLKQLAKEKEIQDKILRKKIAKEKEKQFRIDQAAAVLTIGIQTAVGIITALAQNPPPSPVGVASAILIGAAGLAQTIAVASAPVPKFKHGHLAGTHSGLAMVNDGGVPEVIQRRDGSLEMSSVRNQLINMERGDKVHRNFDSFVKSQNPSSVEDMLGKASIMATLNMHKNALKGISEKKSFEDSIKGVLSEEIKKGFSQVSIKNDNSSVGRAVAQALADEKYENDFL